MNHVKDSGSMFKVPIEEHHSRALFLHMNDVVGSMQDLACKATNPTQNNRQYYIEFLDWWLNSTDKENTLEKKLFSCPGSLCGLVSSNSYNFSIISVTNEVYCRKLSQSDDSLEDLMVE